MVLGNRRNCLKSSPSSRPWLLIGFLHASFICSMNPALAINRHSGKTACIQATTYLNSGIPVFTSESYTMLHKTSSGSLVYWPLPYMRHSQEKVVCQHNRWVWCQHIVVYINLKTIPQNRLPPNGFSLFVKFQWIKRLYLTNITSPITLFVFSLWKFNNFTILFVKLCRSNDRFTFLDIHHTPDVFETP